MLPILPVIFSGFGSEVYGPGDDLRRIGFAIEALDIPVEIDEPLFKPYSVLPGSLDQYLTLARTYDFVLVGHSFGGAAVKWLCDRLSDAGFKDKVVIACLLDAVPNTDRFREFDPSQLSDAGVCWGINPISCPKAFQVFQRSQLFPQGSQIRQIIPTPPMILPSHWNKPIAEITGADAGDNHCDIPADPAVKVYVVDQVRIAIEERMKA